MNYKNISIWNDIKQKEICESLKDDLDVDILIIGGGITGLSTAYHLIGSNLKICLVEKNEVGSGVTSRTTGKLTYLQENICSKISFATNKEYARLYIESQKEAIDIVKTIIEKNKIDCNFEKVKSYIFANNKNHKLEKEIGLLKDIGIEVKIATELPNKKQIDNAIYVENTYVFHPIKYLYALKDICLNNNINIYENTNITAIDKENNIFKCYTDGKIIKAKYVVLAMHYPFFLMPFLLPFKTTIEKSYINACRVDTNHKFSAITVSKPVISMRYHTNDKDNYFLHLCGSHNSCTKLNEQNNFQKLIKDTKLDYLWSNKDIMTNDRLPFIGLIKDNLLIGTGYNTWGMTNGSLAGKILADIILKRENKYLEIFNPTRGINLGKSINFPITIGSTICSFTKTKINKQKNWYPENVKFEKRNGKNIAIYIDENKKEHIVYNLCPHLKCSLLFNDVEKTWDCPCHGSRFDIDGHVIEGPSNYDITYKE